MENQGIQYKFIMPAMVVIVCIIIIMGNNAAQDSTEKLTADPTSIAEELVSTVAPVFTPGMLSLHEVHTWGAPRGNLNPYVLNPQTPEPTPAPTPIPTETPEPTPTPSEWSYYLATSYHTSPGECGNRGDDLSDKNVIALWQTDTDYAKSCVEPFKTFYQTHNAEDYGGLPYGTKVEMRFWTGSGYRYLGVYEVLDTSYTTIYALSEVAQSLSSSKDYVHFSYKWPATNYRGVPDPHAGTKWGHASNWKQEYNNNIVGWVDVLDADWGMVIIEIKVIK